MKYLTKYYGTLKGKILPQADFRLFSDCGEIVKDGSLDFSLVDEAHRQKWIDDAEALLDTPYPQVLASDFIRFYRNGNRSVYQSAYFGRRRMLIIFALAEAMEGKGRFDDRIMDGIWLICDETDWVLPAHIPYQYALYPWYKQEHPYIDLFSAETGSLLAWVYTLVGGRMDAITPQINERLLYTLNERILKPFREHYMGWMGLHGEKVNNWNPWILSNILAVTALCEPDTERREAIAERAIAGLDAFFDSYHSDGGCDEGPSYWTAAGASLFDSLELLYDMTGGYVDLFGEELVRRMGEYEADFHIAGESFVNFADCPAYVRPSGALIHRYGRRVGSERLMGFGSMLVSEYPAEAGYDNMASKLYRVVKNLFEKTESAGSYRPSAQCWYDGIQVMIEREKEAAGEGFFLAVKGGHNAESHNHNDVGTFTVFLDGKPLLLDAGVGEYTKKTFSPDRYQIWTMNSDYHNLPTVNGVIQKPGREYAADAVVYEKENHSLSLNLIKAYPAESGLVSLLRTVSMRDGVIRVEDAIAFDKEGDAVFTLMCGERPDLSCPGEIRFEGALLTYPESLTAELDDFDMDMEDDSVRKRWRGLQIYRILLKSGRFTEQTFTLELRHR